MKGETLKGGYGVETGEMLKHTYEEFGEEQVMHYKVKRCFEDGILVTMFDGSGDESEGIVAWSEINGEINGEITRVASDE